MRRRAPSLFKRRLLIASVVFGLFVLCDLLLFGWLIFRSLSQRELERVLLETRAEAKDLAQRIAERAQREESDLYVVMSYRYGIQDQIDSDLLNKAEVEKVEVFDREGTLVYQQSVAPRPTLEVGPARMPTVRSGELPDAPPARPAGGGDLAYEINEQIGELGFLRVGLAPEQLRQRTAVLRRDLIRQTVWILAASLAVLLSAYAIVWLQLLRARRLEEKAAEADRMAYIGTLAAGLAHEIRNPLNSLSLNMQMLQEELDRPGSEPVNRRLFGITHQELSRLERLVTDFLAYARPRPLELEEVAPSALLARARDVLAGELRSRGAVVEIEDASGGALVRVDRGQLNQLLLNLMQNALAATEESGRPPRLRLAARLVGQRLELVVEDNGVGIAPAEQEKIFEVFYSTRKGGTGLGLAVVERIAGNHDGEVRLESTPGAGTRVTLSLPVAALTTVPATTDGQPLLDTGALELARRG